MVTWVSGMAVPSSGLGVLLAGWSRWWSGRVAWSSFLVGGSAGAGGGGGPWAGPPRSSPPACWSGSAPRPPRATGSPRAASAPERSRLAAGHPAGTRGTERSEYRSGLDGGGVEVAARPAGKRPGPVGAGSRRPAQRGGRSAPASSSAPVMAGAPVRPVPPGLEADAAAATGPRSSAVRPARRDGAGGAWASGPRPPPPARPRPRRGRGPWRTRVAVASWSPSRAAAATARRSRCPAGAGPGGSGGRSGRRRVSGGGSMASCPLRPLRASWPAACASTQVRAPGKTSVGRQDRARATMAWARAR